jgi:hypothetical protein
MTLVPGRLEQSEPAAEALVNTVHAWQHRESIVPSATLRFLLQGRLSRRSNTVNIWQVRYCYSTAVRSRPGSLLAITLNQSILLPVMSTVRLLVFRILLHTTPTPSRTPWPLTIPQDDDPQRSLHFGGLFRPRLMQVDEQSTLSPYKNLSGPGVRRLYLTNASSLHRTYHQSHTTATHHVVLSMHIFGLCRLSSGVCGTWQSPLRWSSDQETCRSRA